MNPIAVMLSHKSRSVIRDQTLASLGIPVDVLVDEGDTPSDANVKRLAWHLIDLNAGQAQDGILYFEDDLFVDRSSLKAFLDSDPCGHDLVILCLLRASLIPDRMTVKPPTLVPLDLEKFRADRGFHGSMALWVSPSLISEIRSHKESFMEPDGTALKTPKHRSEMLRGKVCGFDFWLKDFAATPAVWLPQPIRHRTDVPSTLRPKARS